MSALFVFYITEFILLPISMEIERKSSSDEYIEFLQNQGMYCYYIAI